ncbi:MAG: virulence protein RhuM/Fic/DOC family protein [Candidatus Moranbacteria bacterium]|nr:virulence protein RhuM/Fic/DOC family protein [Candidatus Moranbacteria bacterium]MDD3964925.1 virulence protein RhuM/Fic/DOC family protein [Candidatus Moranbacteria bacterium]
MKKQEMKKQAVIYQAKSGAVELQGDFQHETIWATQAQIADIFGTQRPAITKHLRNIFVDGELKEKSVSSILEHTAADGKNYKTQFYNLDAVISIGYRVNSKQATLFRIWATQTLRTHIVDGYTINRSRIGKNYDAFMQAVTDVKSLLPKGMKSDTGSILELVRLFADTWMSLDAYDREAFDIKKPTKKKVALTGARLTASVAVLKTELMTKGEATELFASERTHDALEGIVGNVMQAFGGTDVYPSIESKAAHLLYFIVKNHPFVDGNKRTGAYSFVWFLNWAKVLDTTRLTPEALTAITLLIAESDPKDKDKLVKLVIMLISKK